MTQINLIMLSGKKRSGKTTAAKMLVNDHNYIPLALADKLKFDLAVMNPVVGVESTGNEPVDYQPVYLLDAIKEYGDETAKVIFPEYRRLMQKYGTEVRRYEDQKHWVKNLVERIINKYEAARAEGDEHLNIVVTDVRFKDEYENIVDILGDKLYEIHGGEPTAFKDLLICIERPDVFGDADTHPSETGVEELANMPRAHKVFNTDTVDDFLLKVEEAVCAFHAARAHFIAGGAE